MLTIILFIIIFLLAGFIWGKVLKRNRFYDGSIVFVQGAAGLIIGMAIMTFLSLTKKNGEEFFVFKRIDIVSMATQNETIGNFYLGTGYIEGQQYYIYFYEKNGGKIFGKLKVDGVVLYEEKRQNAFIDEIYFRETYRKLVGMEKLFMFTPHGNNRLDHYEIHIPIGTTKKQYSLDLKN